MPTKGVEDRRARRPGQPGQQPGEGGQEETSDKQAACDSGRSGVAQDRHQEQANAAARPWRTTPGDLTKAS
jgi:hypothetical protein